ncbi:hypothetical protein BD779DRAFT_1671287 [Infundibulicybe gibba]|nr:hypothetical protein BD779DRAFT_1671287 [Infundibulicybe gibba]
MQHPLPSTYHYLLLALSPARPGDPLAPRKALQDALGTLRGYTASATHIDVLWGSDDGGRCVVRVAAEDRTDVLGAVAVAGTDAAGGVRMRCVRESPFLPALLVGDPAF